MIGDETFETVLAAARAGAEWAWAELYRELAPAVLGYLRARGAPEPEDVTGEVFLQVVRDLHSFAGGGRDFRAWVFAVAHNRLLDERRRTARRPVAAAPDDCLAERLAADDADDDLLRSLAAERVRRVLARLSSDQQAVLLLRIVGDLTVDEVARVVGKRPGAVKQLQRRGLARVARELAREGVTL